MLYYDAVLGGRQKENADHGAPKNCAGIGTRHGFNIYSVILNHHPLQHRVRMFAKLTHNMPAVNRPWKFALVAAKILRKCLFCRSKRHGLVVLFAH